MGYGKLEDPDVQYGPLEDPDIVDTSANPVVPEGQTWETAGGKITGGRIEPGFLKKIELMTSGVHRGVTNFTFGLMSKLPFGEKYQKAIQAADENIDAEQEYNKKTYTGYYPQVGEIAGEMLGTAPAGGLLGGIMKAGKAAYAAAPALKGVAKYGTIGAGAVGADALIESQRYDPNNPGSLFNTEAAMDVIKHPTTSAIMGMGGARLGEWMQSSRALGKAKELDPNTTAADIRNPIMSFTGHKAKQLQEIGDAVGNFVQQASARPNMKLNAEELLDYAAKQAQGALKVTKLNNTLLWEKGFKTKPILDPQGVKDEVINAMDVIRSAQAVVPSAKFTSDSLTELLRTGKMTVDDAKNMQSAIGDTVSELYASGPAARKVAQKLKQAQGNIFDYIQGSLNKNELKDFTIARTHSKMFNELKNQSPLIEKAIYDEIAATDLARSLIGTKRQFSHTKGAFSEMSDKGKDATVVAKIAQAMGNSYTEGHFDLGKFLTQTGDNAFPNAMKQTDVYKSLEGLQAYLIKVNDKNKSSGWKPPSAMTAAGVIGPIVAGTVLSGGVGAVAALASIGAVRLAANHSPLKYILHGMTKNLPENTYNQLQKAAEKHFTRLGLVMSSEGVLKHKAEKEE